MNLMRLIILTALVFTGIKPAEALDPLRIDGQIGLIHMAEFIRLQNNGFAFAIQNGSDTAITLELQRYPTHWPLASFFNIEVREVQPLRLLSSDGREFAGDLLDPDYVRFEVPPLSVRSYAFHGYPGPARHIWLWGDAAQPKFERDSRYIWALLVASLAGLIVVALLRQATLGRGFGLLILGEALALLALVILMRGGMIHPALVLLPPSDKNLLIILGVCLALAAIGHLRFPASGHVLRGYWAVVRGLADLVIVASGAAWFHTLMVGPFFGYVTLDLLPLGMLTAGALLALGALLVPSLPARMQSYELQASPPEEDS